MGRPAMGKAIPGTVYINSYDGKPLYRPDNSVKLKENKVYALTWSGTKEVGETKRRWAITPVPDGEFYEFYINSYDGKPLYKPEDSVKLKENKVYALIWNGTKEVGEKKRRWTITPVPGTTNKFNITSYDGKPLYKPDDSVKLNKDRVYALIWSGTKEVGEKKRQWTIEKAF